VSYFARQPFSYLKLMKPPRRPPSPGTSFRFFDYQQERLGSELSRLLSE